jgi:hypothetical protein
MSGSIERLLRGVQDQLSAQYKLQSLQLSMTSNGGAIEVLQSSQQRLVEQEQAIHRKYDERIERSQSILDNQQKSLNTLKKNSELYRSILNETRTQEDAQRELRDKLIARESEQTEWSVDFVVQWLGVDEKKHHAELQKIVDSHPKEQGMSDSDIADKVIGDMVVGAHDFSNAFNDSEVRASYRKARAAADSISVARGELKNNGDDSHEFIKSTSALESKIKRLAAQVEKQSVRYNRDKERQATAQKKREDDKKRELKRNEKAMRQAELRIQQETVKSMTQPDFEGMFG